MVLPSMKSSKPASPVRRAVKMFIPGFVANASALACRFMVGLQNGDPQNVAFYEVFLEADKNPAVSAGAWSFSHTFVGCDELYFFFFCFNALLAWASSRVCLHMMWQKFAC